MFHIYFPGQTRFNQTFHRFVFVTTIMIGYDDIDWLPHDVLQVSALSSQTIMMMSLACHQFTQTMQKVTND
jgi:hypothetical protein